MGGGKPPPFCLLLYNLAQHKFRAVVNRRGCSVDNVTFLHTFQMVKSVRGDLFIVAPFLG